MDVALVCNRFSFLPQITLYQYHDFDKNGHSTCVLLGIEIVILNNI